MPDDAGQRFIAAGILSRYFLTESGYSGKTAAAVARNFSVKYDFERKLSARSVQGAGLSHSPSSLLYERSRGVSRS